MSVWVSELDRCWGRREIVRTRSNRVFWLDKTCFHFCNDNRFWANTAFVFSSFRIISGSNNLKGTIPTEFCLLQDLVQIDLSNNLLSGNIPSCLTSFNSLEYLQLNNNMLTGTLPPLGLPNMIAADLSNNQLTGTLDLMFAATSILTNQAVLSVLRLDHNQFTGTVPALQSPGISVLTLSHNNMTGTVPFCPQQGSSSSQFETFEVDCTEVSCDCCTNCFIFCFTGNC